jgi:YVTN family beta-propeller protein
MKHISFLSCLLFVIVLPSLAFGGGPFYYTANEGGSISKVDASSNKLIRSIPLEGVVHNVQISPDGEMLAAVLIPKMPEMTSHGKEEKMAGLALFFSTKNDQLVKKVSVGEHPAHIVYTQNGRYALVTNNEDNTVSVIDAKTYRVIQTIATGKGPHGLRISKDSKYAYVANMGEDTISVINVSALKEERRITVGKTPVQTGITSDGLTLVVTLNAENALAVVELATGRVKKIEVGDGPAQVFIEPDDKYAFVANQGTKTRPSNTVSKIDLKARRVTATIAVGKGAHGVVTDNDNKFIYVTNMFDNTVSVIDNSRNAVIATVPVGQTPYGITHKK